MLISKIQKLHLSDRRLPEGVRRAWPAKERNADSHDEKHGRSHNTVSGEIYSHRHQPLVHTVEPLQCLLHSKHQAASPTPPFLLSDSGALPVPTCFILLRVYHGCVTVDCSLIQVTRWIGNGFLRLVIPPLLTPVSAASLGNNSRVVFTFVLISIVIHRCRCWCSPGTLDINIYSPP